MARQGGWRRRIQTAFPPIVALALILTAWELVVDIWRIPKYLLPGPLIVFSTAITRWGDLMNAVSTTFLAALAGLSLSIVIGVTAALVMAQSKMLERTLYPYAVILQTIPIVAIAPLVVIWFGAGTPAVIVISFLISLFPMISNTSAGLTSTDHNLMNMFDLYNANWWQRIVKLKLPFALPYIMTGLRISSTVALILAFTAELFMGTGGLGLRMNVADSFGLTSQVYALALAIGFLGISIHLALSALERRVLHWHPSQRSAAS